MFGFLLVVFKCRSWHGHDAPGINKESMSQSIQLLSSCVGWNSRIRPGVDSRSHVGVGILKLVTVFEIYFFCEKTLGCIGLDDSTQRWNILNIFAGNGQGSDLKGRVVVHLAQQGEEDSEGGEEDYQDSVWETSGAQVADHGDLGNEKSCQNS